MSTSEKKLKEGFTTGTAAAAGAKAALLAKAGIYLKKVETPLPIRGTFLVPVSKIEKISDNSFKAHVIKDGGDDPDVTDKAEIIVTVNFTPDSDNSVIIKGGKGVGKVTKPGLPVPVGEWAINPYPRKQIKMAVYEALKTIGERGKVEVIVEVKDGEKIAKKTLNPKLGIVGGISILGTRGTVKPFSNKAYADTIKICMNVASTINKESVALCTGGRSERLLKAYLDLPDESFIQIGDFFAFSMVVAKKLGFKRIYIGSFFGKLVKVFQKNPYTHAKCCDIDFASLADWCYKMGISEQKSVKIKNSNTASQALDVILSSKCCDEIITSIIKEAILYLKRFAGEIEIFYYLFDPKGKLIKSFP